MHEHPIQNSLETVSKNYTTLLKKAIDEVNKFKRETGPALHKAIDLVSTELVDAEELTVDEAQQLASSLKRDLIATAQHLKDNATDLKSWLDFDITMIEKTLLSAFLDAADKTTVELSQLQAEAMLAEYKTGEIIGISTLQCDNCGERLHFYKPGNIPPCTKCQHNHFHRFTPAVKPDKT